MNTNNQFTNISTDIYSITGIRLSMAQYIS